MKKILLAAILAWPMVVEATCPPFTPPNDEQFLSGTAYIYANGTVYWRPTFFKSSTPSTAFAPCPDLYWHPGGVVCTEATGTVNHEYELTLPFQTESMELPYGFYGVGGALTIYPVQNFGITCGVGGTSWSYKWNCVGQGSYEHQTITNFYARNDSTEIGPIIYIGRIRVSGGAANPWDSLSTIYTCESVPAGQWCGSLWVRHLYTTATAPLQTGAWAIPVLKNATSPVPTDEDLGLSP